MALNRACTFEEIWRLRAAFNQSRAACLRQVASISGARINLTRDMDSLDYYKRKAPTDALRGNEEAARFARSRVQEYQDNVSRGEAALEASKVQPVNLKVAVMQATVSLETAIAKRRKAGISEPQPRMSASTLL